jgi:hypothetical protein
MNSQTRSPSSPHLKPQPIPPQRVIQIPRLLQTPLGQMVTVVMLALLAIPLMLVILLLVTVETILHLASRLRQQIRRLRTTPPTP